MMNTKIILSLIIVILISAVAAGYQVTSKNSKLSQPLSSNNQNMVINQGSSSNEVSASSVQEQATGGNNVSISPEDAKSTAQKYIEEPKAVAGTPELKNISGKQIYVVPVILNNTIVGEIYIDPETGENIGGAGGAP